VLLELLSDVGKAQSLQETRQLVENLRTLREKTLDELLTHTSRIKVVRLAELLAIDLDFAMGGDCNAPYPTHRRLKTLDSGRV